LQKAVLLKECEDLFRSRPAHLRQVLVRKRVYDLHQG
jgi:hypothetical protein